MKQKTLQTLEEGQVLAGTIKNLTEYGAFVDLGGIDGLLHITDMSWGRVNHPSEVFNVGDEVTVKVLKYNPETERVSLGMKQTQEDPWNHAEEAYPIGKRVTRQGDEPDRLRRLRGARAGRRGPDPRQRDELDEEDQASVEDAGDGSGGRVPGARGRCSRQAHQPGPQAARARSLVAVHRQVQAGRQDRRQGPLAHRLRRVRRHRGRRRRHGPQDGPVLDRQGQQPRRPVRQGRRCRGDHPVDQPRREEGQPGRQAALGRPLGRRSSSSTSPAPWSTRSPCSSSTDYGAFVRVKEGIEAHHPARTRSRRAWSCSRGVRWSRPRCRTSTPWTAA